MLDMMTLAPFGDSVKDDDGVDQARCQAAENDQQKKQTEWST
jgi:hypothetical protein